MSLMGLRQTPRLAAHVGKTVQRWEKCPLQDESTPWNAGEARRRLLQWAGGNWQKYARGFGYVRRGHEREVHGYKLPHHDVVNGELVTNWHGVAAAMESLLGARADLDMSERDRRAVYRHLAAHYAEFEKVPPQID